MKCPYCIKICSKCSRLLVANKSNFRKQKNGKYNLRAECKICESKYNKKYLKQYNEIHKEGKKVFNKEYYKENKEKILEKQKEYYEEHQKEIKEYHEKHREERKEYNKQWRKDNPEKLFNQRQKRRLLEESQGNGITSEQWYEMMMFFDFRCAYSGEYIGNNSEYRTIDHIIPLAKCGEHEIWKCVPMYANYNYSKKDKNWLEWYQEQDFYSEERLNKIYEWIEYAKNKYQNN